MPRPISPYGASKLAAQQYCIGLNAADGIEVGALRYFNVFRTRQDPSSQYSGVIPRFLSQALDGVPLVVCGDGSQSRDFTNVHDVVAATLAAGEHMGTMGWQGVTSRQVLLGDCRNAPRRCKRRRDAR